MISEKFSFFNKMNPDTFDALDLPPLIHPQSFAEVDLFCDLGLSQADAQELSRKITCFKAKHSNDNDNSDVWDQVASSILMSLIYSPKNMSLYKKLLNLSMSHEEARECIDQISLETINALFELNASKKDILSALNKKKNSVDRLCSI
jgi:hypothetical protein